MMAKKPTQLLLMLCSSFFFECTFGAAMAQEPDVNYASVVFRSDKSSPSRAKTEEKTLYGEVRVEKERRSSREQQSNDDDSAKPVAESIAGGRRGHCQRLACCAVLLCTTLLLTAVAVFLYQSRVTKLELENDNLMSESKNLTAQKEQLSMQMLALESEMRTLTQQMENLQARVNDFNKFNISRAQRTLDHYCPRKEDGSNRTCNACENGWLYFESRCYLINNADIPYLKTWEEARRECSESNSQLVVVENASEMSYIRDNSWGSQGNFGYWLGLKAEGGRWKWLDGSELTPEQSWQKSWIPQSQVRNGLCAISVTNEKLKAVECSERQRWICKKMPLSL
ncbi:asialoglycoprotein receptor 1 isoform X1 [Phyllopteryx taeniolatus]|uniref:asialoglycoprotein receptor 1 isoform X1 n=1 Tax=Phyllopteryx taeniolatus TaxID=161469 RepID=UPI002AD364D9|nr:asialoglycoprotein receptor 1 isoform X1 [Phyllopteryx taeniolatus]